MLSITNYILMGILYYATLLLHSSTSTSPSTSDKQRQTAFCSRKHPSLAAARIRLHMHTSNDNFKITLPCRYASDAKHICIQWSLVCHESGYLGTLACVSWCSCNHWKIATHWPHYNFTITPPSAEMQAMQSSTSISTGFP